MRNENISWISKQLLQITTKSYCKVKQEIQNVAKKLLESSTDIRKWDVTEVLRTFIIKESEKNL